MPRTLIALLLLALAGPAVAQIPKTAVGVVINTADPTSESVAATYIELHGISPVQRVRVDLGRDVSASRASLEAARARLAQRMPQRVQVLALAFSRPVRVEHNSITSALARGFYERPGGTNGNHLGYTNPWRSGALPYAQHGIRPAMMVAGSDLASTERLIVRGVFSRGTWPTTPARVMRTSDFMRSWRSRYVVDQTINGVRLEVVDHPAPEPIMLQFHGLAVIPDLAGRRYLPGAWVDNLTSYGGVPGGGQTTVWQIIDAGATGSHGTVEEPYVQPSKFPDPATFTQVYTSGATLIEAAWRSVGHPYQGLFVGDPLAAPYAK